MVYPQSNLSHYPVPPVAQSGAVLASSVHAGAALRWLETMRDREQWSLSVDDQCELLGGIPRRTLQQWKKKAQNREPVELSRDVMERLSLLLGIYKAYQLLIPNQRPELAGQWFRSPNDHPLFQGQSVKDFLISRGTMAALYAVRRYLDAARG